MEIVPALYLYPPSNGTRIRKWLKRIVPAGTNNDFTVLYSEFIPHKCIAYADYLGFGL